MKQIREEQQKARQKEVASNRAIQKLKKESRKHENRIKSLEAEAKQKEIVLKRRQEEVGLSSIKMHCRVYSHFAHFPVCPQPVPQPLHPFASLPTNDFAHLPLCSFTI